MSERCDLPTDQCGCRVHAPKPPLPEYRVVVRFPAHFNSHCAECGKAMSEGDIIARTQDGEYICFACASSTDPRLS